MANLVSLADYKTYKKISKTDNDAKLNLIIPSVSQLVKEYCGHTFIDYYATDFIESFNIVRNQNTIILKEFPAVEVVSVETRTTNTGAYTTLADTTYHVDTEHSIIQKLSGCWNEGIAAVKVTYKGGYSATPEDVKLATLDLVHHYFKDEYKGAQTVSGATLNNSSDGYKGVNSSKWPDHIMRVLNMHKHYG